MAARVKDLMLSLSEYAVVDERATILEALEALDVSQAQLPAGRQPHRAILVRTRDGAIVGKLHYHAFLRALVSERKVMVEQDLLDRAGVGDDLRDRSVRMLDLLTGDLVDVCERARHVRVRDVCTPVTQSIREDASLFDAIAEFLAHQTLSLVVRRGTTTVGILRLSDLFDELARQIKAGECPAEESKG